MDGSCVCIFAVAKFLVPANKNWIVVGVVFFFQRLPTELDARFALPAWVRPTNKDLEFVLG